MKKIITEYEFVNEMTQEKYGFSYGGAKALFEHLSELEWDSKSIEEKCTRCLGEELEFDPVALRCEFTEYEDLKELQKDYSNLNITSLEDLYDYTTVLKFRGGLIIHNF